MARLLLPFDCAHTLVKGREQSTLSLQITQNIASND